MRRLRHWFKISLAGLLAGTVALASIAALALDMKAWEGSITPHTKERYIPVELWAGAEWDGKRELTMPKVEGTYRHRTATYQIKGPTEWKHPRTEQTFVVYERFNPSRDGDKWQIFTVNEDQSGLGRLFDGRPGRDPRTYSGGLKFPLGLWKEAETKWFVYRVSDSRETQRTETITIKKIDFAFENTPHCLEFYWTATDRKITYDRHTYIYCPGKSMVSQIQY
jgi:hypothetical protein